MGVIVIGIKLNLVIVGKSRQTNFKSGNRSDVILIVRIILSYDSTYD